MRITGNGDSFAQETVSPDEGNSVSLRALYAAIDATEPHKVVAACFGLTPDKLSRVWTGEKFLGWQRYDALPPETRREYIRQLAKAEGMQVVEPSARMQALTEVLLATALALREGESHADSLPARAERMAMATLDAPRAQKKRA